jgi:hypothetical protein
VVIILPIWLWLLIIAIALIVGIVAWTKKTLVDKPRSKHAVATGTAIPNSQVEGSCRSALLNHELTAPTPTQFVAFLRPLEFDRAGNHARTPICLGLTERTLGVSYKKGSLGEIVTILIDRQDIKTGYAEPTQGGLCYSLETVKVPRITFRLQSPDDQNLLASWIQS